MSDIRSGDVWEKGDERRYVDQIKATTLASLAVPRGVNEGVFVEHDTGLFKAWLDGAKLVPPH